MKKPIFQGSAVALVTPFDENNKVNFDKLAELIDFQINAGTACLVICGTTGESATQTLEEHIDTLDFAIKHVHGRVPVVAGTGSNDTEAALFLSQHAAKSGADGLLLVTPYYNKATQRGLIKHFTYVADRVDLPIILYNVPSRTGCGFTVETYKELSKHPNINGVKEASSNFTLLAQTLASCGDDLNVWCGNDDETVPMMSLGARGVISVLANILPETMVSICNLCLEENYAAARKLHLKYVELMNRMFIEVNPIPVKTAMNLMGMNVGGFRLPMCEMYDSNLEILKKAMEKAGIALK